MTWIETFSGRRIDLAAPALEEISLADIAHALARINRFVGHTGKGYSVGEHSLWAWKIAALERPKDYLFQLHALLHDAHEAYTGDISHPMKMLLRRLGAGDALEKIERGVQSAILSKLRVPPPLEENRRAVKLIDVRLLATEHRCPALMPHGGQHPWDADDFEHYEGLLDGTVGLEPHEMLAPEVWNGDFPVRASFPTWLGTFQPAEEHPVYRPISKPLSEPEVAFLFQSNTERLLSLIEAPP